MFDGTLPPRIKQIVASTKRNAQKRELTWRLTDRQLLRLWQDCEEHCQVSGMPFDLGPVAAVGRRRPFAPSLDRIDCSRGYVPGNVRFVTVLVNLAMNEWGLEALQRTAVALVQQLLPDGDRAAALPGWETVRDWTGLSGADLGLHSKRARAVARDLGMLPVQVRVGLGTYRVDGAEQTRAEWLYPPQVLAHLPVDPAGFEPAASAV